MGLLGALRSWMGRLSEGMREKWRAIFNRSQVAPIPPEAFERQLQWVGDGFYVEDIFEHMISEMQSGKANPGKKKRFGFKTVAKVSRMAAASRKNPNPDPSSQGRRKFKFKSVAQVTRMGAAVHKSGGE